jgi:uncharacterized protein YndB with AHSA1/START domain
MPFQPEPGTIRWRVRFRSPRERVYAALATDEGRATFWAESAREAEGEITFCFSGHAPVVGRVLQRRKPDLFVVEYFGARVEFSLIEDGAGGTILSLLATGVGEPEKCEVAAGWVSVLLAMKAAVDHQVDLRNHDAARSWSTGYADN